MSDNPHPSEQSEIFGLPSTSDSTTSGKKYVWLVVALMLIILFADQYLKIWVKTHMQLGERILIFGQWFQLLFTENPGMAFGLELGGRNGKLFLTFFRLIAVAVGFWFLFQQIKRKAHLGFVASIALILSGAIGNIIDSVFYGVYFDDINMYSDDYSGRWFHGWVVDMLYFPLFSSTYPSWLPWVGGQGFTFFSPVFNIADAAISVGVFTILVFQKTFFPKPLTPSETHAEVDAIPVLNEDTSVDEQEKPPSSSDTEG